MISILMPIYNGIEFLNESIESVINQSYKDWELIIGINGHSKNSNIYLIAKEFESEKIKVLDLFNITGKSNALNEMISYSKYNYIALLDVDDIWNKDKLNIQSNLLNKYDVIGSRCIWFGEKPGIVPKIPVGDFSSFDFKIINPIINSSVLIRKELCKWSDSQVEDYELWLKLRSKNKSFFNFKEILVMHRIHSSSFFNNNNHQAAIDLIKNIKL
jgi:glycosyltransferase involved in cell wall biosynthesis